MATIRHVIFSLAPAEQQTQLARFEHASYTRKPNYLLENNAKLYKNTLTATINAKYKII